MQQVMKPVARAEWPVGQEWLYEVKYDGFRCVLDWDGNSVSLTSKYGKDLSTKFPEITEDVRESFAAKPPLTLDGELVILNTPLQANFSLLQQRGRLKNAGTIAEKANMRPATYMAFDLVKHNGNDDTQVPFSKRKKQLKDLIGTGGLRLRYVPATRDINALWQDVFVHRGEGIIAKRKTGTYQKGKQHHSWFKVKNWRTIKGVLTGYNTSNGYFTVQVKDGDHWREIGKCKHGLDAESRNTLEQFFKAHGKAHKGQLELPPAIEAGIHTLDLYEAELREPEFVRVGPLTEQWTADQLEHDLALYPESVDLSNADKLFWPDALLSKGDMLIFLRKIAPYMLPFLKDRALTLIRFPDGVTGTHFYQKHLPDYAPDFFKRSGSGDDVLIQCRTLQELIWLGNHGTLEYHMPFQMIGKPMPSEIVFDLDPPDREQMKLAVKAAHLIKQLLDGLHLASFIKTSGGKGLQIHIPLPDSALSYEDTALFTEAIAKTVEQAQPDLFTTERMKNKRKGRLYIDYVQHGKDKTIIAPYSPRSSAEGTVATPLFWHEVTEDLRPEAFTIENVVSRVQTMGCPFADYFTVGKEQKLEALLERIK
ncbi:DNA ligase (ATP) [Lentibacillus sp. JNUCC-1]|uniref:DNA ligase D n=1 Tax=Lentibacillus sp. JNUCC-1 TaxID=2654513 RepID=UPI0013247AF6|nr:DNA ligase D [Lentibacillus sp. JNUCC-1]MUV37454.1 DNA ligase (ATP) [Lentibacillus sp. JNUCC-1]